MIKWFILGICANTQGGLGRERKVCKTLFLMISLFKKGIDIMKTNPQMSKQEELLGIFRLERIRLEKL